MPNDMENIKNETLARSLYVFVGLQKGYKKVSECISDVGMQNDVLNVLMETNEVSQNALERSWYEEHLRVLNKKMELEGLLEGEINVADTVKNDGILMQSIIECKNNAIFPYYTAKIMAYAFLFKDKSDSTSAAIKEYAEYYGIKEAARKFCKLEHEPELLQLIEEQYLKGKSGNYSEDTKKIQIMKEAFRLGFNNEKKYRGCAQCTLLSMFEITKKRSDILFQSASGLAAGMAQSGDGACGGYTGGIMQMGSIIGRRIDQMKENGDREVQLVSYRMSQTLRDKFIQTYGSVICKDIHKEIFGKSYCLRTQAVKKEFDEAGAHETKCTTVIGTACVWISEILYDEGYLD